MIPLVVRSHYSLMWGTADCGGCAAGQTLGYHRLALTDTDNLYGLWPFLAACRREGITPIVGAEVTEPGRPAAAGCVPGGGRRGLRQPVSAAHPPPHGKPPSTCRPTCRPCAGLVGADRQRRTAGSLARGRGPVAAAMPRRPLPPAHPLRRTARAAGGAPGGRAGQFFPRAQRASGAPRAAGHRLQHAACPPSGRGDGTPPMPGWRRRAIRAAVCRLPRGARGHRGDLAERLTFPGLRSGW